ncbi:MAG: hypothetical protein ACPGUE_14720 [Marinomonas sp.]
MKHRHYEMICAKSANMDLVKFQFDSGKWIESVNQRKIQFSENGSYFLCLPQHKEACLHWLNGGEVQIQDFPTSEFYDHIDKPSRWSIEVWWMSELCNIRIKPRKEKRWIAYASDSKRLGVLSFSSLSEISDYYSNEEVNPQFIEIEVEA